MKTSLGAALFVAPIIVFACCLPSYADRGMMMVSADPGITLTEGAQRAVIAFNGSEEILILSTDIRSSADGTALEFLPLPSPPEIEESSRDIFERALYLISAHAPEISSEDVMRNGPEGRGGFGGIEVLTKKTVGPHDITVVKIEGTEHFAEWIGNLYRAQGIETTPPGIDEMKKVVDRYLARGIPYFAFDLVTIDREGNGVAPLSYRFKTESLYYPLEISSVTTGGTEIDLFLVTPGGPKEKSLPEGFSIPDYVFTTDIFGGKETAPSVPVSVPIDMPDRVLLSPAVARLIPGWETKARLTVVRYRGPLSSLSGDLVLMRSDFSDADFEAVTKAVDGRASLFDYAHPGTIDLAVGGREDSPPVTTSASGSATFYLGGGPFSAGNVFTFESSYTAPAAADGDPSTPFVLRHDGTWSIDFGKIREVDTVDVLAAVPIPDRDTSYTYGLRLLASDTGRFAGEQKMVGSGIIESYTRADESDDPARHARLIRLAGRPFTARFLRIEYIPYGAYNDIYLLEVMPWGKPE
jgi:hypothetical protein